MSAKRRRAWRLDSEADTAVHEAGHAVACRVLSLPFGSVTIEPRDGMLGCVDFGAFPLPGPPEHEFAQRAAGIIAEYQSLGRAMPDGQVLALLGGRAAHLAPAPGQPAIVYPARVIHPDEDLHFAATWFRDNAVPPGQRVAAWRACEAFTWACRAAIAAVAAALPGRRTLTFAEVSEIAAPLMRDRMKAVQAALWPLDIGG